MNLTPQEKLRFIKIHLPDDRPTLVKIIELMLLESVTLQTPSHDKIYNILVKDRRPKRKAKEKSTTAKKYFRQQKKEIIAKENKSKKIPNKIWTENKEAVAKANSAPREKNNKKLLTNERKKI